VARDPRREQRKGKRTPRRQAAWVVLDGGVQLPCVLWDISLSGARIAAARAGGLPDVFGLFLSKDGKARRFCRVAWRRGGQLGVQFVDEAIANIDLAPRPAWIRRQPVAVPAPAAAPSAELTEIDTIALMMPGYGAQLAVDSHPRAFRWSSIARTLGFALLGATALFVIAGLLDETEWAVSVCTTAENFCRHPEWTGAAGVAMFAIYLAVSGMED
jgi:PilZ domain